jgi:hypothetical protein
MPDGALAIVGTRVLACPGDRDRALARALAAIRKLAPAVIVSGGADGVDKVAEEAAGMLGYTEANGRLVVFRPTVRRFHGPGGYRERDAKIARHCTHLLRIYCRQATTYGSGWTADEAKRMGAVVVRHLVCP